MRPRWAPQSSKLLIPIARDSRFDSDTFPRKMKGILLAIFGVTLLCAQSPKLFWDGHNWLEIDRLTVETPEFRLPLKRAYVRGLINGNTYDFFQVQAADSNLAGAVFRDYLGRFEVDELVRGTDQFYQDPANRYLPVISALMITSLGAMGFPDSVVLAYTRASRDWINHLTSLVAGEVPVKVEGIAMPAAPKTPGQLEPTQMKKPRKWYNPRELTLP